VQARLAAPEQRHAALSCSLSVEPRLGAQWVHELGSRLKAAWLAAAGRSGPAAGGGRRQRQHSRQLQAAASAAAAAAAATSDSAPSGSAGGTRLMRLAKVHVSAGG
jgi:hypothetical protein